MATGHQPQGGWLSRPPLSVASGHAPWAQNLGQKKAPRGEIRKNPAASDDEPKPGADVDDDESPKDDENPSRIFVGLMVGNIPSPRHRIVGLIPGSLGMIWDWNRSTSPFENDVFVWTRENNM